MSSSKSEVWKLFTVDATDDSKAICNNCKCIVIRGNPAARRDYNTTNMWRHLNKSRRCQGDDVGITAHFASKAKWHSSNAQAGKITKAICIMMAKDLQPFSLVEDEGFQNLMSIVQPRYDMPSRRTFCRKFIPEMFATATSKLEEVLSSTKSRLTLTADCWTSCQTLAFLGITCHWISAKFERKMALLEIENVVERHTAENISQSINDAIEKWCGGRDNIFAIATDNAATMIRATSIVDVRHQPCFAHTLNLIVCDALKEQAVVISMLSNSRRVAGVFHRSPRASELLKRVQLELQMNVLKIPQDISTRWNSAFIMLQAVLKQKPVLLHIAQEYPNEGVVAETIRGISYQQWDAMANLVLLLEPFYEVTNLISRSQDSVADQIPLICSLKKALERVNHAGLSQTWEKLNRGITTRLSVVTDGIFYKMATSLDPRYKFKLFSQNDIEQISLELADIIPIEDISEADVPASDLQPPSASVNTGILSILQETVHEQIDAVRSADGAVAEYFREPTVDMNDDPIKYWSARSGKWPTLATYALSVLACPSTSVASERVFSIIGRVIEERRNRLTPENIKMLAFLKYNM